MGKFVAETAVEALEYDFTKYVDGDGAAGIIPEPSTSQLEEYFDSMKSMVKGIRDIQSKAKDVEEAQKAGEDVSDEEMDKVLAEMDEISFSNFQNEMARAVSRLCSNQPSEDQISKLPFRVKQAFIQWITGEFRPEGQAPTTRG